MYKDIYIILKNICLSNNNLNQIGGTKKEDYKPEITPEIITPNDDMRFFKNAFYRKIDDKDFYKLKATNIGKYSITFYNDAKKITHQIKNILKKIDCDINYDDITITDASAGIGGNTISFARKFGKVNSIEILPIHCSIIENNVKVYKLEDKVNLYCDNYFNLDLKQDVIFFDPPWGGKDYYLKDKLMLYLDNKPLYDIVNDIKDTKLIVLKVPINFDFETFYDNIKYKNTEQDDIKHPFKNKVSYKIIYLY